MDLEESLIRKNTPIKLLLIIFLIGFSALIYQIYSVQVLFMFFVHNSHAVSIAISSFLAGLAISSLLFSRITENPKHYLAIIFWMQSAAALYGFGILHQINLIPTLLDFINAHFTNPALAELLKLSLIWVFLLIPAMFVGGALPLINGLYVTSRASSGRDTGTVYFWDTFGAILGALVAGFWLIPYLGLHWTIMLPIGINLLVCLLCTSNAFSRIFTLLLIVSFALWIFHSLQNTPNENAPTETSDGTFSTKEIDNRFGAQLFQKESPYGRITVGLEFDDHKTMFVNYRDMCTTRGIETGSETELSRILARVAPKGKALNVGMGCGFTAQALIDSNAFSAVHVVEINPIIREAAQQHFSNENKDVFQPSRAKISIGDGAAYLRTTKETYSAIAIDVEEVNVIYSSPLYTKEYFEIAKQKMAPNGVIGVWSFAVNAEFARVLLNTLSAVFTYAEFYPQETGHLFFASNTPLIGMPILEKEDLITIKSKVDSHPNNELNTLGKMNLEKYYNMGKIFSLPEDYDEKYLHIQSIGEAKAH